MQGSNYAWLPSELESKEFEVHGRKILVLTSRLNLKSFEIWLV
jgi:hypothetical protein